MNNLVVSEPFVNAVPGRASALLDNIHGISCEMLSQLRLRAYKSLYNVQENTFFIDSQKKNEKRHLRFELQDLAKFILQSPRFDRFQKCCSIPVASLIQVLFAKSTQSAYFGGLCICGNIWNCPVCGAKIMYERCRELLACMESFLYADPRNHEVLMMVMTHSHKRCDSLQSLMEKRAIALKIFFQTYGVVKVLKSLGSLGHVNSFEITYSKMNGFHPHNHVLFFNTKRFKPETGEYCTSTVRADLIPLADMLYPYWENACKSVGLTTARDCFEIVGGNLSSKYVQKLHLEMTLSNLKYAGILKIPHYTPMQMLYEIKRLRGEGKHTKWLENAFKEYSETLKGHYKQLTWSRGLKGYFGLNEVPDEVLAKPTETDIRELLTFYNDEFVKVKSPAAKAEILNAAKAGEAAVRAVLIKYKVRSVLPDGNEKPGVVHVHD